MFRKIGKVLFLVGGIMAAILIVACGRGEQGTKFPNPTTNTAVAKAATTPTGKGITPKPTKQVIVPKAATNNPGSGIAPKPTGEGDLFAFTPSPPTASKAANPATPSAGMAGVAATVALAAMAAPPPPDDPVDPCRALPCSDDSDPWLGCRYAAALYRDAPGTTQGVRSVVGKMSSRQLEWYKSALLESYRHDLWYSADYRLGAPGDLEQTHRDVRAMVFGSNDVEAMGEDVICEQLGSTEITLADVLAASRANSPFVAKKKAKKEESLYLRDPFTPDAPPPAAEPAAPPAEPSCEADPCPPPSDAPVSPEPGPSGDQVAPATPTTPPTEGAAPAASGCGADPCPPPVTDPVAPTPPANPVPAEPPAGEMPPATPAFDPAAVPPATDPVPVAPPATDPAAPSEPEGATPPAKSGEGTVAYYSGHGF